jgi:alkylresorcinol/alkylpyrone synthase
VPRIAAVATASPAHRIDQDEAAAFASTVFRGQLERLDSLLPVFANAGIRTRYVAKPPQWYSEPHDLAQKNRDYIESATALSAQATRDLLACADLEPHDIDAIIYINTTGLATPTIDARLINVLGMRDDIRRTPIWGLGCAGGAAGLSHAYHHALGHPRARILVVACELCSLTFLSDDFSKSNFVATALFADGAAAALVLGDEAGPAGGLELLDTQSHFYPDSLAVMGWNVLSSGLQVVFDKRIPDIVADHAAGELDGFLARHDLTRDDVVEFLYHPGGIKVLEAYQAAYGADPDRLRHSRAVLGDYGNMSSVTVLFVIARYLAEHAARRGGYGVISALGPGFSSESILVAL